MSRAHRRSARSPRTPHLSSQRPQSSQLHPHPGGHRTERSQHILREQLQAILRTEASDPLLWDVVLVSLELSDDGGHARLAYAVARAGEEDEHRVRQSWRRALERADGFLRTLLADRLGWKRIPRLSFTFVGLVAPIEVDPPEGGDA